MVKKGINRVFALISALFLAVALHAQDLPLLPADPSVKTDVFQNGMTCFVVSNPGVKGFADYAVVRRSDSKVVMRLSDLPSADAVRVDSTLLSMVKMVEDSRTPADYGLFVCGDMDASSTLTKLRYMSLMIAAGNVPEAEVCEFRGQSRVQFSSSTDSLAGCSVLTAQWTSPRTPDHLMKTLQKAVYDKAVYDFGYVFKKRIQSRFKSAGIPVTDVFVHHEGSADVCGDEKFKLSLKVDSLHSIESARLFREVLSTIDMYGAYASELSLAEESYFHHLRTLSQDRSNSRMLDKCIKSFIHNAPIVCEKDLLNCHRAKNLSDRFRESSFAAISSALIQMDSVAFKKPSQEGVSLSDTLMLPSAGQRTLLRSSRKDHLSEGLVWTFANGFKVVYKKMPTAGKIHYSLAMNGGYGTLTGIMPGEDLAFSDYLDYCYISGVQSRDFKSMLTLAGMHMDERVNFSNIIIDGSVDKGNIGLMMKALLAVANKRSLDQKEYDYYMACRSLDGVHLDQSTAIKAHEMFDRMSSSMNDGVLVIVADMEESKLRRELSCYVGGFRTKERALRRINVNGYSSVGVESDLADDEEVALTMTASLPMTLDNHVTAEATTVILNNHLQDRLSQRGLCVEVSHTLRIYPEERYKVVVRISGSNVDSRKTELMWEVRSALSDIVESGIDQPLLNAVKAYLKHKESVAKSYPSYWLHAIALRYLDGKNYTTGFDAKVDSVTSAKITSLLSLLEISN